MLPRATEWVTFYAARKVLPRNSRWVSSLPNSLGIQDLIAGIPSCRFSR